MTLKQIGIIAATLAAFFLFGWVTGRYSGRNSVRMAETGSIAGVVTAEDVADGLSETKPDTVYIPVTVYAPGPERVVYSTETQPVAPDIVPVETVPAGTMRDAAVDAALIDWNTKRSYKGTLFDSKASGTLTYAFEVQFNRAGQIDYRFDPAPVPKPRARLRPTIGGEYYTNGQYAFGGGVQYGAFGLNVRALKSPKSASNDDFAFGVGAQIMF